MSEYKPPRTMRNAPLKDLEVYTSSSQNAQSITERPWEHAPQTNTVQSPSLEELSHYKPPASTMRGLSLEDFLAPNLPTRTVRRLLLKETPLSARGYPFSSPQVCELAPFVGQVSQGYAPDHGHRGKQTTLKPNTTETRVQGHTGRQ